VRYAAPAQARGVTGDLDMAQTNAERQRAFRERRRDRLDEARWQSWCERTGHDPAERDLATEVHADIAMRTLSARLRALERVVREAATEASLSGATVDEIWRAIEAGLNGRTNA
jgi:hypothetical protein